MDLETLIGQFILFVRDEPFLSMTIFIAFLFLVIRKPWLMLSLFLLFVLLVSLYFGILE